MFLESGFSPVEIMITVGISAAALSAATAACIHHIAGINKKVAVAAPAKVGRHRELIFCEIPSRSRKRTRRVE